jgi:hypothetical protein
MGLLLIIGFIMSLSWSKHTSKIYAPKLIEFHDLKFHSVKVMDEINHISLNPYGYNNNLLKNDNMKAKNNDFQSRIHNHIYPY